MLSSSLYTMIKLSKTSSPQKTVRLRLRNAVGGDVPDPQAGRGGPLQLNRLRQELQWTTEDGGNKLIRIHD